MELTDLEKIRFDKIGEMRANGLEPFPTRTEVNQSIGEAIAKFEKAEAEGQGRAHGEVRPGHEYDYRRYSVLEKSRRTHCAGIAHQDPEPVPDLRGPR